MRLFTMIMALGLLAARAETPPNLALGKPVFYSLAPDNPQDTTPSKLTDGKKNVRLVAETTAGANAAAFDEQRSNYTETMNNDQTVGWHFKFYGRENLGVNLCIDLGQPEKLGRTVLRAGSFTETVFRFSLPREFQVVVSNDGENFYRAGTIRKITTFGADAIAAGEHVLKVREDRNQWHEIELDLTGISARYVGMTVRPEGFMFYLDEWEIFAGDPKAPDKTVFAPEKRERFAIGNGLATRDAVVFQPTHPTFYVPENINVPTVFDFGDYRSQRSKEPYQFVMDLPPGVTLVESAFLKHQFDLQQEGNRYVLTPSDSAKKFKRGMGVMLGEYALGPLYFRATGTLAADAQAVFFCRIGAVDYTPSVHPVKSLLFPVVENRLPPFCAITWMTDFDQANWPDFLRSYSALGFNAMPYFPRYVEILNGYPDISWQLTEQVAQARAAGMRIIQNESPLHTMKNLGKVSCTYEGAKGFCPSYRGEHYQLHLQELAACCRALQPDYVFWDIEMMHRSFGGKPQNIMACERCAAAVAKSGKTPEDYLYDCGEEILRDLHNAAAGAITRPFQVGQYDLYAAQEHYQHFWMFSRAYPKSVQLSMPAAYTAGLFDVNHQKAQQEYRRLGQKWLASMWVTSGTYGYCSPHKMEALVYEQLLNGGNLCIYSFSEFTTPLQLYTMSKGLKTLSPFQELLERGKPDIDFKVGNDHLAVSRFATEDEALLFIANYSSPENETLTLNLPTQATRLDQPGTLPPGQHRLNLGPAEFMLYHIR